MEVEDLFVISNPKKYLQRNDFRYLPEITCLLHESVLMCFENWSNFQS
jgi:hypothetical protein